jgi:hypothetical protein
VEVNRNSTEELVHHLAKIACKAYEQSADKSQATNDAWIAAVVAVMNKIVEWEDLKGGI